MGFFEKNFQFRTPFQILLDGTFANAALNTKVNIQDQLPKYLNGPVKLLTSPCIVTETEKIGPQVFGALNILKQFGTHKCTHTRTPAEADKCILSMVTPLNPNRYIVATQDSTLRDRLREIPGVAIIYLHRNAPTLEKPSDASVAYAEELSLKKMEVMDYQKDILDNMKKAILGTDGAVASGSGHRGTMKRKRAGPNPLSCKKSKKKTTATTTSDKKIESAERTPKRKRVKVRIPVHVKAERRKFNSGPSSRP